MVVDLVTELKAGNLVFWLVVSLVYFWGILKVEKLDDIWVAY